jgi:outer membrane protein, multidrug efflux system
MRNPHLSILASLLLGGCTVGPSYNGPAALPAVSTPGETFVRASPSTSPSQPALAQWWTMLNDPVLNTLQTRALAGNPGLEAARARIAQARQNVRFERADRLPAGSVQGRYIYADLPGLDLEESGGSASGQPTSPPAGQDNSDAGTTIDFFNLGLNANWEIDLWGGKRRSAEAASAQLGAAVASEADAQVQLTAEVAQTYTNVRERQHRLASLRRTSQADQKLLDLAEQRFRRGTTAAFDVEQARTRLRATNADVQRVEAELEVYLNALSALTGAAPGVVDPLLTPVGSIPLPPASVAVGDPASLLARRPDVRAAERNLAAATARIGVVEAARLPKISFMGILGLGGASPGDLFDLGNMSKIALPQIEWGLLDFGRSLARLRQTRSARDEAEAQYRQAVLSALQDAESSLSRFGRQRQSVAELAGIKASADRSAALMRQRYDAGAASLSQSLEADRQALDAERNLDAAIAALTGSFIAVQKSLGLGWQLPPVTREGSSNK